jgi:hypothetical protein
MGFMEPLNELRFAVSDRINDAEVGPKYVPLSLIDAKRAAVIECWQTAVRQNPYRKYKVADAAAQVRVAVDSSPDFRRVEDVWVQVEKYLAGRIVDWGGKTRANVRLETEGGTVLVVAATQELLAQEEQNRLYRPALLHISAEENLLTGVLRNPRLLAFEAYQPAYDENEFQQMVSRGTAAWADVPNATEWLGNLRDSAQ